MTIGFMFTGQGSEYLGRGLDLVEELDFFKTQFKRAQAVLGYDPILALQDESTFTDTSKIQPLTFLLQATIIDYLKSKGIDSTLTFGLSLGEYAAYYDAGVFSFEEGLELLMHRGLYMQENVLTKPGKMCAFIGMKSDVLEPIIDKIDGVVIANYNTHKQLVISGTEEAVKEAISIATKSGLKRAMMLETVGAFHSPLMNEAKEKFASYIEPFTFPCPNKTLFVNVTGDKLEGNIKDNMANQITSSVKFYQMVEKLEDIDLLIEIGPKNILCNMVKRIDRSIKTMLINDKESLRNSLEVLNNEL